MNRNKEARAGTMTPASTRIRGRPGFESADTEAARRFRSIVRASRIDRSSKAPLWVQMKTVLENAIYAGVLPKGTRLPSEQVLCDAFGLSRPVVRNALAALSAEGLVIKEPRRGMFVASHPPEVGFMTAAKGSVRGPVRQGSRGVGQDLRFRPVRGERCRAPGVRPAVRTQRDSHLARVSRGRRRADPHGDLAARAPAARNGEAGHREPIDFRHHPPALRIEASAGGSVDQGGRRPAADRRAHGRSLPARRCCTSNRSPSTSTATR